MGLGLFIMSFRELSFRLLSFWERLVSTVSCTFLFWGVGVRVRGRSVG